MICNTKSGTLLRGVLALQQHMFHFATSQDTVFHVLFWVRVPGHRLERLHVLNLGSVVHLSIWIVVPTSSPACSMDACSPLSRGRLLPPAAFLFRVVGLCLVDTRNSLYLNAGPLLTGGTGVWVSALLGCPPRREVLSADAALLASGSSVVAALGNLLKKPPVPSRYRESSSAELSPLFTWK